MDPKLARWARNASFIAKMRENWSDVHKSTIASTKACCTPCIFANRVLTIEYGQQKLCSELPPVFIAGHITFSSIINELVAKQCNRKMKVGIEFVVTGATTSVILVT